MHHKVKMTFFKCHQKRLQIHIHNTTVTEDVQSVLSSAATQAFMTVAF